jgi:cysteine desulfuration protein SufE
MSGSATIPASLDKVLQRFVRYTDPKRKYELLLWFASRLGTFPEAQKVDENKVPGCASQVFITAQLDEAGNVEFAADSDSQLTKGLAAVLVEGLNGLSVAQITQLTPDFIQVTGLNVSLTASRVNGFYNILKTMQQKALGLTL